MPAKPRPPSVAAALVLLTSLLSGADAPPGPDPGGKGWTLVFRDDFDRFEPGRWERASHTFTSNAAYFRPENVTFSGGTMRLLIKKEDFQGRRYTGGELRSEGVDGRFTHGRFVVRMKPPRGGGLVSSFFLYRSDPLQEIDIEFLGKDTSKIQLNVFHNAGRPGDPNNQPRDSPVLLDLGFDASAAFHEYTIEWEPGRLRWYADGRLLHTRGAGGVPGPVPDLPVQLMMNAWPSEAAGWAGPIEDPAIPAAAEYDSVAIYRR